MENEEKKSVPWDGDKLNRKTDAEFLTNYLVGRYERQLDDKKDEFVLNINSEWGFGKTYFLTNWAEQLRSEGYSVIYFDAWRTDFSDQPLLSFISEIREYLRSLEENIDPYKALVSNISEKARSLMRMSLPILASIVVKKATGYSREQSSDELNKTAEAENSEVSDSAAALASKLAEQALQQHETLKASIDDFRTGLGELVDALRSEERKLPLFIFVDELDRCRPNYAIELLENIKHLFNVPGVYFVIATDSSQLKHSIGAVYGESFDSERYLRRFFTQEYEFVESNNYDFVEFVFEKYDLNDECLVSPLCKEDIKASSGVVEIFVLYAAWFNLSIRDQDRMAAIIKAICLTFKGHGDLISTYLFFLVALKIKSNNVYKAFVKNHDFEEVTIQLQDKINEKVSFSTLEYDEVGRYRCEVEKPIGYLLDKTIHFGKLKPKDFPSMREMPTYVDQEILRLAVNSRDNNYLNSYPNFVVQGGRLNQLF